MTSLKVLLPLAIISILGLTYFFTTKSGTTDETAIIKNTVQLEDFVVNVTATGELKAKRSEKIRGPQGLRQANIYNVTISDLIPEGTVVKEGDYVAELDRSELDTKIKDIQSEIEKIETQLAQTEIDTAIDLRGIRDQLINMKFSKKEKELEVEQSKYEAPMVIQAAKIDLERSNRDYQQLLSKYDLTKVKTEAQINEIKASLKQNTSKLERFMKMGASMTITAPKDGMLIYKRSWNGRVTTGSQINLWDPTVAELPDLTDMVSKTFVNEVDISRVKKGQDVTIKVDAFPDKTYSGAVISVANIGEELRNYDAKVFEVMIQVNEMDSILRPAMTTSNDIVTDIYESVLSIPMEALFSDSLTYVLLEKNGKTIKQEVITGVSNNDAIVIDHGLKEGDVYLMTAPENVEDLDFAPIDQGIKDKIRREQEEDRKARQAKMAEKLKKVDGLATPSGDDGGGGFMIIN